MLQSQLFHLIVIYLTGIRIESILHRLIDLAGKIGLGAVGKVTAMSQAHTKNGIPGLHNAM